MFDCIVPSALAKQGVAFTSAGRRNLFRGVYRLAEETLDPRCGCPTCRGYSRAYLHHLAKTDEPLGWSLLTRHNLEFVHDLMRAMRQHVIAGTFATYRDEQRALLVRGDDEHPPVATRPRQRRRRVADRFVVRVSEQGWASVADRSSGEVMHPGLEPMAEAHALYVEQSRMAERLAEPRSDALVIWDVGLGAAHNAMAAIRCCETTAGGRPVHLVSFEHDDAALRLALRNVERFPHLQGDGPRQLLRAGEWRSPRAPLRWTLLPGDFRTRLVDAPPPDCVFYDPFSYKTDTAMWTLDCFARLFAATAGHDTELFTYSASTAVRAALLAAGFVVARGIPTGARAETTVAMTPAAARRAVERGRDVLGVDWLDRWRRSGARFPSDVPADGHAAFGERITRLAQFQPASAT
jgi:queuine tRNA-ribosyltransferase